MEIGKKQRDPMKSLSRQVVDSIEEMIMERKLGPGDVLPTEIQISEELQVSKSSVREAIKMLEALGVVEIRRGLCTVISKNPEQGYMNVMLSHYYLNSGNEEDLQNSPDKRSGGRDAELLHLCVKVMGLEHLGNGVGSLEFLLAVGGSDGDLLVYIFQVLAGTGRHAILPPYGGQS